MTRVLSTLVALLGLAEYAYASVGPCPPDCVTAVPGPAGLKLLSVGALLVIGWWRLRK